MTPERARWLLEHPVTDPLVLADPGNAYRSVTEQRDGALLTMVLAVDR